MSEPAEEPPRALPALCGGGDRGADAHGTSTKRAVPPLYLCAVSVDAAPLEDEFAPEDELSVIRRAAAIEGDARSPRPPSEEGVQHELLTALRCEAEGG